MDKLPNDIMLDILYRLPYETIINCKLVSKPWRDITNNIKVCFIFQSAKSSLKLCYGGGDQQYDAAITTQQRFSYKTLMEIDNYRPTDQEPLFDLVGSCNGLVCLSVMVKSDFARDPIYICNPITEEYVYLPIFDNYKKAFNGKINGNFRCGFGYHHSTDEYKVVRIYNDSCQTCPHSEGGQVQVYTLGCGQGWRDIGRINHKLDYLTGVCANGSLHWIERSRKNIVAFDLEDEEFRLIPIAPLSPTKRFSVVYLKFLGGCLCVVHIDVGEEDTFIHVWALVKKKKFSSSYDDFNDFWGWSKKLSLPCGKDERCFPFAVAKSNQVLMSSGDGTVVFSYDLETRDLRKLWDDCPIRNGVAIAHVNSLVSLEALGEKSKRK